MASKVCRLLLSRSALSSHGGRMVRLMTSEAQSVSEKVNEASLLSAEHGVDDAVLSHDASESSERENFAQSQIRGRNKAMFRSSAFEPEEPYARTLVEYNSAMAYFMKSKRGFMLRDVYEDMLMDGISPSRDTFHMLIPGAMFSNRLQDAFFFFNEMKQRGMQPDIVLYNVMISACGKAFQVEKAFQIAQEMESMGVPPKFRTFLALLQACGISGRVLEANGVVQRMALHGLFLNPQGYVALIEAYKNRRPKLKDTAKHILELLEQSKSSLSSVNVDDGTKVTDDELPDRNEDRMRRLRLICHQAALKALVELREYKAAFKVLEDVKAMGLKPSSVMMIWTIRAHIDSGDIDSGMAEFENAIAVGNNISFDLYVTLLESCIQTFKKKGLDFALKVLNHMESLGYFLNAMVGGKLLTLASKDYYGDFAVANKVFDMLHKKGVFIPKVALLSYITGLKRRNLTPEDEVRLAKVQKLLGPIVANLQESKHEEHSTEQFDEHRELEEST